MEPSAATLPPHVFGYVRRTTRAHQLALAVLSVVVFALSALPLELQRRIVNDALRKGTLDAIVWLALAYAAVALLEGLTQARPQPLSRLGERQRVRHLRGTTHVLASRLVDEHPRPEAEGIEISMMLAEAEPIGLFVGSSLSEPILQGGILLSVFGYMFYIRAADDGVISLAAVLAATRLRAADAARDQRAARARASRPCAR